MPSNEQAYAVLGLPSNASDEEVRARYRELAKIYHLDASRNDGTSRIFSSVERTYRGITKGPMAVARAGGWSR